MPLNIDDPDTISQPEHSESGPDLHEPPKSGGRKLPTSIIVTILVVLIVAAGAYLIWQLDLFGLNSPRQGSSQQADAKESVNPPPAVTPDTASMTHQQAQEPTAQPQSEPVKTGAVVESRPADVETPPAAPPNKGGTYTIYISRHRSKETADEEASRWKQAGYETFVSTDEGWYKLAIGRYATWDEAKDAAEGLKDAFESGYKIGSIAE